jgi:hypothetical protein
VKIKDPKTGEEREETEAERKAREAAEAEEESGDEDEGTATVPKAKYDQLKLDARKWEKRAKDNFSSKVGIPWDDVTTAAQKYTELEAKNKTDSQRAADDKKAADERAQRAEQENLRLKIGMRKGLSEAQLKRLTGATEEELEADADELLSLFKANGETQNEKVTRRPQEKLKPSTRSGTGQVQEPPADIKKIVDEVMTRT